MGNLAENTEKLAHKLSNCKKANIGSGQDYLKDYINIDKYDPRSDIQGDVLNIPLDDGSMEEVILSHVIEHISFRKHIKVLEEIHRVSERRNF